jgi:hypothetical protein
MRSTYSVALPLVAVLLLVQIVPAASAQADATLFELHGKVVNALTGEPVGGALLLVYGQPSRFSDSDGNFTFTGLNRGRHAVLARKPGFFNEQELGRWIVPDVSIEVPSDQPAVVRLTPEAIIYGEVKNGDGEPLEDVAVRAERWQMIDGRRRLQVLRETRTDDEGSFRLAELVPGKYYLSFSPGERSGGVMRRKRTQEEGYGPQFYPGVADAASASALQIQAGAQLHVAHTLVPQRVFQVSGTIRGGSGNGFLNLVLLNSSGEPVNRNVRIERKSGEFRIQGVPAGSYLLTATQFLPGLVEGPPPTVSQPLQVSGDVSGILLAFGVGISLGVQLRDEIAGTEQPHRAVIRIRPKDFILNEQAIMTPPMPEERRPVTRFENLFPGTYSVEAQAAVSKGYVAELRCGNVDLLRDDLVIAPGAALPPIELTLREDAARLTVVLKNTSRATPVLVYSPEYPRRSLLTAQVPGSASISIPNLPPGPYQVLALTDAGDLEFRNPAAMEKYLGRATSVTLPPYDNITVSVETVDVPEQQQ